MLRKIKFVFILAFITVFFVSCQEKKCVKVVDVNGEATSGAMLTFSVIKEVNDAELGGMVTTFYPLHETDIGNTNEYGQVCFNNHKAEDSSFLYKKMRTWVFHTDDLTQSYSNFESIPPVVVLEKRTEKKLKDFKLL